MSLGGRSPVLLAALQEDAADWAGEDYTLAALADLAWALAWARPRLSPALLAHLESIVEQQGRDWRRWAGRAAGGRLAMLLWGLATLRIQPCQQLLEAACLRLAVVTLDQLSSQVWQYGARLPPCPPACLPAQRRPPACPAPGWYTR